MASLPVGLRARAAAASLNGPEALAPRHDPRRRRGGATRHLLMICSCGRNEDGGGARTSPRTIRVVVAAAAPARSLSMIRVAAATRRRASLERVPKKDPRCSGNAAARVARAGAKKGKTARRPPIRHGPT